MAATLYFNPARVQEDASNQPTAGTAYNLSGTAETGMRSFAEALADGHLADGGLVTVLAEEVDANGNPSGAWERAENCVFTDAAPDTLSRGDLLDSSTGSAINWATVGAAPRLTVVEPPGMGRLVAQYTFSGTPSAIDLTWTPIANRVYRVHIYDLKTAGNFTDNSPCLRAQHSGTTWLTTSGDYGWAEFQRRNTTTYTSANTSDSAIELTGSCDQVGSGQVSYSAFKDHLSCTIDIIGAAEAQWTRFHVHPSLPNTNDSDHTTPGSIVGAMQNSNYLSGIRLFERANSQQFVSGEIRILEL